MFSLMCARNPLSFFKSDVMTLYEIDSYSLRRAKGYRRLTEGHRLKSKAPSFSWKALFVFQQGSRERNAYSAASLYPTPVIVWIIRGLAGSVSIVRRRR